MAYAIAANRHMGVVIQRLYPKAWKEVREPVLPHTARCDDHAGVGRRGSGFDVGYQARVGREESAHDAAEDARGDQLDPVIAQCPSQPGAGSTVTSGTCLLGPGPVVHAGLGLAYACCIARRSVVSGGLGVVRLMCIRGQDHSSVQSSSASGLRRLGSTAAGSGQQPARSHTPVCHLDRWLKYELFQFPGG